MPRVCFFAILCGLVGPASLMAATPKEIRAAVQRALPLIEKSAVEYTHHRSCFSCHHQGVPMLALTLAREKGFPVESKNIEHLLDFTAKSLERGKDGYRKGHGQGGQVDTAGYALLALDLGKWKADDITSAVTEYLLQRDSKLDHWKPISNRPPSEASVFTTTYLAMRGLLVFGTAEQKTRIAERKARVLSWLLQARPRDTEDRVFHLLSLHLLNADEKIRVEAAKELRDAQRKDGGWAQTAELESDAYATGSVLVALHQTGQLAVEDEAYQRGLDFLLKSQLADGTWHVKSRSRPFQVYFESGFPHGKDQFISIAASSWSTAALLHACKSRNAPQEYDNRK